MCMLKFGMVISFKVGGGNLVLMSSLRQALVQHFHNLISYHGSACFPQFLHHLTPSRGFCFSYPWLTPRFSSLFAMVFPKEESFSAPWRRVLMRTGMQYRPSNDNGQDSRRRPATRMRKSRHLCTCSVFVRFMDADPYESRRWSEGNTNKTRSERGFTVCPSAPR